MKSFPWDSMTVGIGDDGFPVYDRAYDAQDLRDVYKAHFTNGVVRGEGAEWKCAVDPDGEPMSVSVGTGIAHIQGSTTLNESAQMLPLQPSEANPRIDSVVIRFNKNIDVRDDYLAVVKGTASANPVHPQLTRTDDIYELAIADVRVPANATSITAEYITSTVADAGRCGYSGASTPVENITGVLPVTKGGTGVTTNTELLKKMYPVGAVYISYVNTSPASLFGGTWANISGKVLRMANDVSTGGSDTHVHSMTSGAALMSMSGTGIYYQSKTSSKWDSNYLSPSNTHSASKTSMVDGMAIIGNTGSTTNLPAYQDLYAWRRTT